MPECRYTKEPYPAGMGGAVCRACEQFKQYPCTAAEKRISEQSIAVIDREERERGYETDR